MTNDRACCWGVVLGCGVLMGAPMTLGGCAAEATSAEPRGPADTQAAVADGAAAPAATAGGGAGAEANPNFGNSAAGTAGETPAAVAETMGSDCAPGHYAGRLAGMYRTQVWGNGGTPVPFATDEVAGQPGLEFWLERVEKACTAEEFCGDFAVKGGKLRGWANPTADPNAPEGSAAVAGVGARFEMELTGELNCATGEFQGVLQNACYDVFGTLYRMEGTLRADYDATTSSFEAGHWDLVEMPMAGALIPPDPNVGGAGSWSASLADDGTSPIADGMGLCDAMTGFETML